MAPGPQILPTDPPQYAFGEPDEFDPKSGPRERTTVVIHGKNLATVDTVLFGNVPASKPQLGANERITAVVPDNARTGPITLSGPRGEIVSRGTFKITPRIDTVSIALRPGLPPAVQITGDHLGDVTEVDFNGVRQLNFTAKMHEIDTTVPPGVPSGIVKVTVIDPAGRDTATAVLP